MVDYKFFPDSYGRALAKNQFADQQLSIIFSHMRNYRARLLDDTIAITKALADAQRLRIIMALRQGELCSCQLAELLHLAHSTVSKHMSILRHARLVVAHRRGRWTYFRRADAKVSVEAKGVLGWLDRALAESRQIKEDARRAAEIKKQDVTTLCRKKNRR